MFDTFTGLPVHALILHATVVLLPLMSVLTVLVALVPRWRRTGGIVVAVGDALMVPLTWATIESGEVLQNRLSQQAGRTVAEEHGEQGSLLLYFAIALFVAGLVVAFFGRNGGAGSAFAVLVAAVIGAAVIGWTVYVGDLGAREVWEQTIENAPPASGG